MRLLVLSKRRPQGRDLFLRPYGRFYHLPRILAEKGHDVHILLLDYKKSAEQFRTEGNLHIHSFSAFPTGPFDYLRQAIKIGRSFSPDWLICFSDIWYGLLGIRVARYIGSRVLIDAYDNYESYIPWALPLHKAWRKALGQADALTVAGPQLAELFRATAGVTHVHTVPMAADPCFTPIDKLVSRKLIGLPENATLVGYTGSIHSSRGIEDLFSIFHRLHSANREVQLVLSGRLSKEISLPANVLWLGYRPDHEVPAIVNSLDLLIVLNKSGSFGDFSYPSKLYEAMACNVPVVAADVPAAAWILRNFPSLLARTGDIDDFVRATSMVLTEGPTRYGRTTSWHDSASIFESILADVRQRR